LCEGAALPGNAQAVVSTMKRRLRSQDWFGKQDKDGFIHRSWFKNQGYPGDLFDGRPVIGICNTWSEMTPCNGHFREIAEFVKRGVYEAGGFPLEFPVMSLGETQLKPAAMLFRNLASMDVGPLALVKTGDIIELECPRAGCIST
jgi:L-arabonate dehydrase